MWRKGTEERNELNRSGVEFTQDLPTESFFRAGLETHQTEEPQYEEPEV